jgi:glycosyltransferase involved in cell wall biosynthesis
MDINSKKIAVLCNYELLPSRVGGMDYFFWLFDKKCKDNNLEVDWFFPNKATHGDYSKLHIIESNYENVETFFAYYCKTNTENYTFVIAHFVELCAPVFKRISKLSDAKVIVVDHNPRPLNGYSFKKKTVKRIKGLLYSRYISKFVGVSEYTTNEILKDFGNHLKLKTKTIYNGVLFDDILKRNNRFTNNPTFLVASHLRKSKGIQDLIDAVALLSEDIKSKIEIDIYGDGPYKTALLEKVKGKKLEENFNFKGSKSNLKSIFYNYDYMLQPTHMECFSLSILESLAANVPVVTTNVGGNEEVITHAMNGFVFPAKDIKALKELLESLVNGDKSIKVDTRNLIEEHFSLEKMVQNHFQLIDQSL